MSAEHSIPSFIRSPFPAGKALSPRLVRTVAVVDTHRVLDNLRSLDHCIAGSHQLYDNAPKKCVRQGVISFKSFCRTVLGVRTDEKPPKSGFFEMIVVYGANRIRAWQVLHAILFFHLGLRMNRIEDRILKAKVLEHVAHDIRVGERLETNTEVLLAPFHCWYFRSSVELLHVYSKCDRVLIL